MTAKRMQNTHEKPNNWSELKKRKLFQAFHKLYCVRIKIIKISKSYKNQNQIKMSRYETIFVFWDVENAMIKSLLIMTIIFIVKTRTSVKFQVKGIYSTRYLKDQKTS